MFNIRLIVTPSINLVKHSSTQAAAKAKILQFMDEHRSLVEAFFVALSLHVAFFPLMWVAGWALPWPRVPICTTIIEYDLRGWTGWPKMPKPKKIFEVIDPDLNK
jgi:hypothetical protein